MLVTEFIKRRMCMKENALSKKRLDYLDLAKGIGILIVMLGHFPVDGEPHISRQLYDFIFSFHMPLFFIITGIIFGYNRKWEKQTFKELFIKKLKTIIYPYFTLSAAALILQTLEMVFLHFGSPFDLQVTVIRTLTFRGYNALWYLPALFFSEIVFFALEKLRVNRFIFVAVTPVITSLLAVYVYPVVWQIGNESTLGNIFFLVFLYSVRAFLTCVFIYAGFFAYKLLSSDTLDKHPVYVFSAGLLLLTADIVLFRFNSSINVCFLMIGNPFLYYICSFSGSFAVILMCRAFPIKLRLMSFIGINSLVIMATHNRAPIDFAFYFETLIKKVCSFINFFPPQLLRLAVVFIILVVIEIVIVLIINRFLPFVKSFPEFGKNNKSV